MTDDRSFAEVIGRLNAGDDRAAAEIFDRYARRLIGLARSRLDARVRRTVDPEDVVQSVFRSFFTRQARGGFELADWDGMWGLLIRLTFRKCGRKVENLHAACRDVRREVAPDFASQSSGDVWELVTREPRPEEVVCLTETVEHIMRGLDETQREIVMLRLQGYTNLEISESIGGVSERTVYRVLAQLRKRLEQTRAEEGA